MDVEMRPQTSIRKVIPTRRQSPVGYILRFSQVDKGVASCGVHRVRTLRCEMDELTGNQSIEAPNLQGHDRLESLVLDCSRSCEARLQPHRPQPNLGQRFDLHPGRTPLDVFDHRDGFMSSRNCGLVVQSHHENPRNHHSRSPDGHRAKWRSPRLYFPI